MPMTIPVTWTSRPTGVKITSTISWQSEKPLEIVASFVDPLTEKTRDWVMSREALWTALTGGTVPYSMDVKFRSFRDVYADQYLELTLTSDQAVARLTVNVRESNLLEFMRRTVDICPIGSEITEESLDSALANLLEGKWE